MGIYRNIAKSLRSFNKYAGVTSLSDFGWRNFGGQLMTTKYAGSDLAWDQEAGSLFGNAVITLCLQYCFDKVVEPIVECVTNDSKGEIIPIPRNEAINLLLHPNQLYSGNDLLCALAMSYKTSGNAYIRKVRNGGGLPTELHWVPEWQIRPVLQNDTTLPPTGYVWEKPLSNGQTEKVMLLPRDVIHIRNGVDPTNPHMGYSEFKALLRAVVADNEIDTCTAVMLRNKGILGTVLTPKAEVEMTPQQAEQLKTKIRDHSTGDSRADIIALSFPVEINQLNSSAQDLALTSIGDRPMQRICGAFGIDPTAIFQSTAAQGGGEKYGSMRKQALESSYRQCVIPMLAKFAEAFTYGLLPDWGVDTDKYWIEFDYTRVADLEEDKNEQATRVTAMWQANLVTQNEARAMLGLPPMEGDEGDVLFTELSMGIAQQFMPEEGKEDDSLQNTVRND